MICVITASRSLTKDETIAAIQSCPFLDKITYVLNGGAEGGDTFAKEYFDMIKIPTVIMPAEWSNITVPGAIVCYNRRGSAYNKLAGIWRNQDMVDLSDCIIAIIKNNSSGASDCLRRAREKNLLEHVCRV